MTQQSYGADRAAAFRAAERGEWIEPEVAAKAEASKAGLRIPQCGDNASPRDLIEARHAARTLVNRITSRMMKDGREPSPTESAALDFVSDLVNDCDRRLSLQASGGAARMTAGETLGAQVAAQVEQDREIFDKTGSLRFTIRGAAADPLTTSDARTVRSVGVGYPGGAPIGAQYAVSTRAASGISAVEYSRRTGVEGAAAVQAAEGDTKAAVRPTLSLITQAAIPIAGYTKLSKQAASDQAELRRAVDSELLRSNDNKLDDVLTGGSVAPAFAGLESLATSFTSLTYTAVPDAVSEGVATMVQAGFRPDVVVLNPADWLATQVAKSAVEGLYLTGDYLNSLPEAMRGLRVVVSPGLTAGKALLLDSAQVELLVVDGFQIFVGYDGNDFTKNLVTVLGERRVIPTFRATGCARLITPKAA